MIEDANCLPTALATVLDRPYAEVRERFHAAMPYHQFTTEYFDKVGSEHRWKEEAPKLWEVTRSLIPVTFGPSLFYIRNASPERVLRWLSPHRKWLVFACRARDGYVYGRHVMAVKNGVLYNCVRYRIRYNMPFHTAQEIVPQIYRIELISPIV